MDNTSTRWLIIMLAISMVAIFFIPQINQCNASNAQQEKIDQAIEEALPEVTSTDYKNSDALYEATGLRLNPPKGVSGGSYSSTTVDGATMAQLTFTTDAISCTYRQMKTDDFVDISDSVLNGIKWETTEKTDINGANWTCSLSGGDKGLALHYDTDTDIMYAVAMEGPDLTMRKLQAIVGAIEL